MKIKMQKNKYKNSFDDKRCIVILLLPALIHLVVFWLGVQLETIKMAFTNINTGELFLGNFKWALSQLFAGGSTNDINLAFRNTMGFFIMQLAIVPISVFFAYLIYRRSFGYSFMRIALYLPGAVSGIMMGLLYQKLMASDGPLMQAIQHLSGSETPIMLVAEHGVLYIMIFDILIGVGGNLVIWLGCMSRIPYDLIEYGKLEGIGPLKEFKTVILPLIWPTFTTMLILQIMGIFGASGSVQILTDGQHGTYTLAYWMYRIVKEGTTEQYNLVAALGLIFTVLSIPLVIVGRKLLDRWGEEVQY